jgi:transketolase
VRTAFFKTLEELAEKDPRITFITGDLGFSVVETYARRFPNQFLNAGVAEANMTGVAVGLALSGKIVFTYSIGNFPTLRCLEQIRNDACYHRANVKIVSVGGGLSYGALGSSHHATEDLAIFRVLPEITVVAPADPVESALATRAVVQHEGPLFSPAGKGGGTRAS